MTRGAEIRDRMLLAAARLFRTRGYEGVGVAELLAESGAPRGSLYFHFPGGKQQIAEETLRFIRERGERRIARLTQEKPDAREFIDALFGDWIRTLVSSDFTDGCAIALIALEMSAASPELRAASAEAFDAFAAGIAAAARGWGMREDDSQAFGRAALAAMQGAVVLARATKSAAPMEASRDAIQAMAQTLLTAART